LGYRSDAVEFDINPGSRSKGVLEVGPYFSHNRAKIRSFVSIPYTVVRGTKDGPTLCITAGVHGTEYVGIAAATRLSNAIKPDGLKGKLAIVPVVNVPAFLERAYMCPIDGVNIQGSWPGRADGSIAHMIAHRVFSEFISKADYYLDLHGADSHESEIAFAHFQRIGNGDIDLKSEGMARALGLEYITVSSGETGKGYSYREGPEHGKPTAVCELGQGDRLLLQEVSTVFDGLVNVMKYLKMLDGPARTTENQKILLTRKVGVKHGGLFHSAAKPGTILSKGDIIGEVKNLDGEVIETVHAPTKGIILLMIHNPLVEPGEKLMTWGEL
jgi:predicted deacylase